MQDDSEEQVFLVDAGHARTRPQRQAFEQGVQSQSDHDPQGESVTHSAVGVYVSVLHALAESLQHKLDKKADQ